MSTLDFSGNELRIGDCSELFDFEIRDAFEFQDKIIVRLTIPPDVEHPRNVYAVTRDCERVWQIEAATERDVAPKAVYTTVYPDGGDLSARTWGGDVYTVDPASGEIEYRRWVK